MTAAARKPPLGGQPDGGVDQEPWKRTGSMSTVHNAQDESRRKTTVATGAIEVEETLVPYREIRFANRVDYETEAWFQCFHWYEVGLAGVGLCRSGTAYDGPWGVELDITHGEEVLTTVEAGVVSRDILAAVLLAEQLNRVEAL